jgi:hypothetical protein
MRVATNLNGSWTQSRGHSPSGQPPSGQPPSGQLAGIERAIERKSSRNQVLQSIAAARGAIDGFLATLMEEHIQSKLFTQSYSRTTVKRQQPPPSL